VAIVSRRFTNHYELAAHLLSQVSAANEEPVTESGLGRVDLLFELLARLGLDTPDGLHPYLKLLHGDLERRPLAEQIIDALIAEDESRYDTYRPVRMENDLARANQEPRDDATLRGIGRFLMLWAELERLLRELIPRPDRPLAMPTTSILQGTHSFHPDTLLQLEHLRIIRNRLVHGSEALSSQLLAEAALWTEELIGAAKYHLKST
jgi:hypothetical protein